MERKSLNDGWRFRLGKSLAFEEPGAVYQWRNITLPHDFMIESTPTEEAPARGFSGYFDGGLGVYEKQLFAPENWKGKKIILQFDGVYKNAVIGLNGHTLQFHPYGYTPFHVDLTDCLEYGQENRLSVRVNNTAQPNSRWYTGSGIYRSVDLLVSEPVYIVPWGVFAYTEDIVDGMARVLCQVTVKNETPEDRKLFVKASIEEKASCGKAILLKANSSMTVRLNLLVSNPHCWDLEDPFLYKLSVSLNNEEGRELDRDCVQLGIRTISVDTRRGFLLNGKTHKLKGGCVHHDNGILGAASFYDSEYRKMKLHKENGYNAIRCAHNPPSKEMLDACDRLGLLVIDEAFDKWRMERNPNDYHLFFEDWWERDMESFIKRDRNHPCIVMWSTGNEVDERGGLSDGNLWAEKLANKVRSLDPSRLVTHALCSMWSGLSDADSDAVAEENRKNSIASGDLQNVNTSYMDKIFGERTERFASCLDVVGYNYLESRYEKDGAQYPDRVICGTESIAMEIDRIWDKVERLPYVIGDFAWTSYDYIGEAGIGKSVFLNPDDPSNVTQRSLMAKYSPYPWRLANDADFDICGFDRPQLHYRKVVWGSKETYISVQNPSHFGKKEIISMWGWPESEHSWSWTGSEGKKCRVFVYSAAPRVELFLNNQLIGVESAGKANRYQAEFVCPFSPGVLAARSVWTDGSSTSDSLETVGKPVGLRLTGDRKQMTANAQDLTFVTVEIVDEQGRRVPMACCKAKATVSGPASLAAFGSANPMTEENYSAGCFTSYDGCLQAIVRAGDKPGIAKLTVETEAYGNSEILIELVEDFS